MHYVYVLKNKENEELHYRYTANLEEELKRHDNNWKLIYYEAFISESDAKKRVKRLKNNEQSREHLNNHLDETLEL